MSSNRCAPESARRTAPSAKLGRTIWPMRCSIPSIDHYYPVLEGIGAAIDSIEDDAGRVPLQSPVGELHNTSGR